ncbi:MAG: transcription elongation factor GreB, partial [Pseudohongiellaceae bacterium]
MSVEKKPLPKVSNYITVEGEKRLRDELIYLWRVERPKVTQQVSDAAALGDRSENAEYIYGKKRLREIDRRVRHLRKRLELLTIVDKAPSDTSRI